MHVRIKLNRMNEKYLIRIFFISTKFSQIQFCFLLICSLVCNFLDNFNQSSFTCAVCSKTTDGRARSLIFILKLRHAVAVCSLNMKNKNLSACNAIYWRRTNGTCTIHVTNVTLSYGFKFPLNE